MKVLIDFLTLRPVFTRRGLQVIWYFYLIATLLHVGTLVGFSFSAIGRSVSSAFHWSLVGPILFALAHLALVRLFLEMALRFITRRNGSSA